MCRQSIQVRVVIALALILGASRSVQALDLRSTIDPLAQPLIDDGQAVGFVVGIYQKGKTQIIGYGETEKGSGDKPTGRTVYEIGSATKAVTGVLLADMVRRGEVKLDDPLQKYLPEEAKLKLFEDKPITLEHVATHTSGLPRLAGNMAPADPTNPYADYTPELLHEFLGEHQIERAPGKYEYSNLAMGMLGFELARSKGQTYEELLSERITKPLGLKDTSVKLSPSQRKRLAKPYNAALKLDKNWDLPTLAGAGGVRSTAVDMLVFLKANLAEDEKPLTQSMKLSHEKRHTMDDGLAIGLGWHIARDGVTWWHNGMTGGYASWTSFVPEHDVAVVILSNTATHKITELGEQLTRVACGTEVKPPKKREPVAVALDTLKSYEGTYAITPQFGLTVTVEDGKLMVQATGQQKFEVYAESPTEFFYTVVDAQLTFEPGKGGKAKRVTLHQNGQDMKAERQ
jgi:serine-type D-Ala-D-Ala carboxypeptidase/endopeptidase